MWFLYTWAWSQALLYWLITPAYGVLGSPSQLDLICYLQLLLICYRCECLSPPYLLSNFAYVSVPMAWVTNTIVHVSKMNVPIITIIIIIIITMTCVQSSVIFLRHALMACGHRRSASGSSQSGFASSALPEACVRKG
jgi:hypothetical protein